MEFDHAFICVRPGATEAEALREFGLTEGTPNQHPGQGTANRRFFFENGFLELLYLTDSEEVRSAVTNDTKLHERLVRADQGVSPFGICFRPERSVEERPAFDFWRYRPSYLPNEKYVAVSSQGGLEEPMWFFLSFGRRPDEAVPERRQIMKHVCGFREITRISVCVRSIESASEAAQAAKRVRGMEVRVCQKHRLEIGFDNEMQGQEQDFGDSLPLVFRW
jgi:hypothetical protein